MGNLKLYGKNDQGFERLLSMVKIPSNDIDMEFGLDECAKAALIRRTWYRGVAVVWWLSLLHIVIQLSLNSVLHRFKTCRPRVRYLRW